MFVTCVEGTSAFNLVVCFVLLSPSSFIFFVWRQTELESSVVAFVLCSTALCRCRWG